MKCFIFTSKQDLVLATICKHKLQEYGATVFIVADSNDDLSDVDNTQYDIVTSFKRNGRLFSTKCSLGMYETILNNTVEGDIVCKVDSDMFITQKGYNWLKTATVEAHGFRTKKLVWLGCWSIPRFGLEAAYRLLQKQKGCSSCAEAYIAYNCFSRTTGYRTAYPDNTMIYREQPCIEDHTMLITLPSGIKDDRVSLGEQMFRLTFCNI